MITITKEDLQSQAKARGYRAEILEKVIRLLNLLEQLNTVPYLRERLVLKGGTAINLFCTNHLPRLSVDLDFNYVGAVERSVMQQERNQVESIILDVCSRLRYELHRHPGSAHAGGKMVLEYQSLLGNKGRLEIDMNYMFRIPLWGSTLESSADWPKATQTAVINKHELAAGKLHALLGRKASRDLFDSHQLLTKWSLDSTKLRTAFTVYAGMESESWQTLTVDKVDFTVKDIRDRLLPVLKRTEAPDTSSKAIKLWADRLMDECKTRLASVLPFQPQEIEFLDRIQKHGEIRPDLICIDDALCARISRHPSLLWRVERRGK